MEWTEKDGTSGSGIWKVSCLNVAWDTSCPDTSFFFFSVVFHLVSSKCQNVTTVRPQ